MLEEIGAGKRFQAATGCTDEVREKYEEGLKRFFKVGSHRNE